VNLQYFTDSVAYLRLFPDFGWGGDRQKNGIGSIVQSSIAIQWADSEIERLCHFDGTKEGE
jgi:hypothetical protein